MIEQDTATGWNKLRETIQGRWNELTQEDLETFRVRLTSLAETIQRKYGITYDEAKQQVQEFEQSLEAEAGRLYRSISKSIADSYRSARNSANEFAEDVKSFGLRNTLVETARQHPATTLATAFVAGFMLNMVFSRKRSRYW